MEVKIISREMIKPSSPTTLLHKPHQLCLLDQLTPSNYSPFIIFYLNFPHNPETLLKTSLSQLLNSFYPFSGRIQNNLIVDTFDAGVLFLHAKVSSTIVEFLRHFNVESLNKLLPFRPLYREADSSSPLIAFQANQFACGGMALGISCNHKISDGMTLRFLVKSWAAIARDSYTEIEPPNFTELSVLFPPIHTLPQKQVDLMEPFWFRKAAVNNVTRRFVFSYSAIDALKKKASSKSFPNPSKIQTLTGFIWKHATEALKTVSEPSLKIKSVLAQVMDMRPRMKPCASKEAMGNLIWWATAVAEGEKELHETVRLVNDAIAKFSMAEKASMGGYFKEVENVFGSGKSKTEVFMFTSLTTLFNDVDFGGGVPFWTSPMGKAGPEFINVTMFYETKGGGGIEAWVTFDQKIMAALERDAQFLAFNSVISNL